MTGFKGFAVCCLNTGQEPAQHKGPHATRICPEYTPCGQSWSPSAHVLWFKAPFTTSTKPVGFPHPRMRCTLPSPRSVFCVFLCRGSSGLAHNFTQQNKYYTCYQILKTTKAHVRRMKLLWVAVCYCSARTAVILLVVWTACMLNSFRGGTGSLPAVLVRAGRE